MRRLTILGSGGSMGVPIIGCDCAACSSDNPRNQRLRCSALIDWDGRRILLDAGPDLRQQALRLGLSDIDGVMLTHMHNDHVAGLDDLRVFKFRQEAPVPLLVSKENYEELMRRFPYLAPTFSFSFYDGSEGEMEFGGVPFHYFSYLQAGMDVKGFRFGKVAYVTDIKEGTDKVLPHLRGVETLVVSSLREAPSPVHLSLSEGVAFGQKSGAKQVYFTHIAHELEHEKGNSLVPEGMELAYDGLEIML